MRAMRAMAMLGLGMCFLAAGCGSGGHEPDVILGEVGGTPTTISQSLSEGGPNPAMPTALTVSNVGTCDLDVTATAFTQRNVPWLTVSPASTTISAGSMETLDVSFDVVSTNLKAGTYTGSIEIAGTCVSTGDKAVGSPKIVGVNLTVEPNVAILEVSDERITQDLVTLQDVWDDVSLANAPTRVAGPTAVWTGRQVVVWGGVGDDGYADGGGLYDPLTNTWSSLSTQNAPYNVDNHGAVWTGDEMIVLGGTDIQSLGFVGASWDPNSDTWSNISTVGAPPAGKAGRNRLVWTGTEVFWWVGDAGGEAYLYNPASDTWRTATSSNAPSARTGAGVAWSGTKVLVWGGNDGANDLDDGALYDPTTDTWTPLPADNSTPSPRQNPRIHWTGHEFLMFGPTNNGAAFSLETLTWGPTFTPPDILLGSVTAWTGEELLIFGHFGLGVEWKAHAWNPATETWRPLSLTNIPTPVNETTATWTGRELFLWGGDDLFNGTTWQEGKIYR